MSKAKSSSRRTSYPEGPYTTGCCDVMVGRGLDGTLMRIYYPTSLSHIDEHRDKWTSWYLGSRYSQGLGKFFMPWVYPGYHVFSDILTRKSYIPSVWEAPVSEGRFPLVIFSHGLAAHRSLYSSVCNDLASHGFVVAAVEHRDRSACATFHLKENGKKKWILIKTVSSIKYEFDIRFQQIKTRSDEVIRALEVLERLDRGEVEHNELPSSLPLGAFKGKIDVSRTAVAGHSFGGGTTLLALSRDKRFKAGICLDPWMYPLNAFHRSRKSHPETEVEEMDSLSDTVEQPVLFILMECFQDEKNLNALKKYENERNKFWTLLKALHQNQTDTPMLFKKDNLLLKKLIGCCSDINPDTAMKLNNNLMIDFLCKTFDFQTLGLKDYQNYIFKHSRWAFEGAEGSAKCMAGWHNKIKKK